MKIEGLQRVVETLRKMAAKAQKDEQQSVSVGYTARYALFVHENYQIWPPGMRLAGLPRSGEVRRLSGFGNQRVVSTGHAAGKGKGFYWDPQGRATFKFLEGPARQHAKKIAEMVRTAYHKTKNMAQSLLMAGLFLQRESMLLVPVNTGALKASAFTKLDPH